VTPGCTPCLRHARHERTRTGQPWHTGDGENCGICGRISNPNVTIYGKTCVTCSWWAAEEIEYLTLMAAMGERINAKTVR